jgi:hypothetical protein
MHCYYMNTIKPCTLTVLIRVLGFKLPAAQAVAVAIGSLLSVWLPFCAAQHLFHMHCVLLERLFSATL